MSDNDRKDGLLLLLVIMIIVITSFIIFSVSSPAASIGALIGQYLIGWLFWGAPFIFFIAFPWYYLLLSITLPRIIGKAVYGKKRYYTSYIFIVALLAFIIDLAFGQITWMVGRTTLIPFINIPFSFVLILVPISMYWLINATLSYIYLGLKKNHSVILGIIMGFFNTSWVPVILPYITGYDGWFVFFPVM